MLIINLTGLGLIILIIWWFWLYKPRATVVDVKSDSTDSSKSNEVIVVVDAGIYQPAHLLLPENKPLNINFIRKDSSSCAATVMFPDFDISAELPLNKLVKIHLPAMQQGEYVFHCQMKMYNGTLLVK
jgi:plastocyanin domain-containing protein